MEENLKEQSANTLTPKSLKRGEDLLKQGRVAEELGDEQTLKEVKEKILGDHSFGEAVREGMDKQDPKQPDTNQPEVADEGQRQEDSKEDEKSESQNRLSKVVDEIKDLYKELVRSAVESQNPGGTYNSIGENGEKDLRAIVEKVTQLLDTGASEDVEEAMKTLNVDIYADAITVRIRRLVIGYFSGVMPDALRSQAMILDRIKVANESLKTANSDWQKLKE